MPIGVLSYRLSRGYWTSDTGWLELWVGDGSIMVLLTADVRKTFAASIRMQLLKKSGLLVRWFDFTLIKYDLINLNTKYTIKDLILKKYIFKMAKTT